MVTLLEDLLREENIKSIRGVNIRGVFLPPCQLKEFSLLYKYAPTGVIGADVFIEYFNSKYPGITFQPHYLFTEVNNKGVKPSPYYLNKEILKSFK